MYFTVIALWAVCAAADSVLVGQQQPLGEDELGFPIISTDQPLYESDVKQVAIIGAGPAGAATAYYLRQLSDPSWVNITIFEQEDRVGGRIRSGKHSFNYGPDTVLEWGVESFQNTNPQFMELLRDLDLERDAYYVDRGQSSVICDITGVVDIIPSDSCSWSSWATLARKFGLGFVHANRLANRAAEIVFKQDLPTVYDAYDLFKNSGMDRALSWPATAYFYHHWIKGPVVDIYTQVLSRAYVGQSLDSINALSTALATSCSDRLALRGGNYQLVERMIQSSGAHLRLSHTVTEVRYPVYPSKRWTVTAKTAGGLQLQTAEFDAVVLAVPPTDTSKLCPDTFLAPPEMAFSDAHVYYMELDQPLEPPWHVDDLHPAQNLLFMPWDVAEGPEVLAASLIDTKSNQADERIYLYRIVTKQPLDIDTSLKVFNTMRSDDGGYPPEPPNIIWRDVQYWPHAWPERDYREHPFKINLDERLWTTGGGEAVASTVGMAVAMGKNVAEQVLGSVPQ